MDETLILAMCLPVLVLVAGLIAGISARRFIDRE